MENLKLGIRIASIVVGLIVYCGVWNYIIDNFNDSFEDSVTCCWNCYCRSLGLVLKFL